MHSGVGSLTNQWMQFTPNRAFLDDPLVITGARGIHFQDQRGRKILDGSSGLYCCPLGHGRDEIREAVTHQLKVCDYAPPFSMASDRSFELAEQLTRLLPQGFNKVFFTNSGSESVDTAMKLSVAYQSTIGEKSRVRFVSRERAYHGVNLGGISLNGQPRNRGPYESILMPNVSFMRHTWTRESVFSRGQPPTGAELAEDLQRLCDFHGAGSVAACFVEPVAGSTGCLLPPVGYLERLREICDQTGVLLVFDEVICGFHRLGAPFGAQKFGVKPDIITMAKALSNGNQPIGAVAVADHIWNRMTDALPDKALEFVHGYTTGGHPVTCAAAIEAQKIYQDPKLAEHVSVLSEHLAERIFDLQSIPRVLDIRISGLMCGVEFEPNGPPGSGGSKIQTDLVNRGMFAKCSGDVVTLAPPFVSETQDIDTMIGLLDEALKAL